MKGSVVVVFVLLCTSLAAQTSRFVASEKYLEHEDAAYYAGFLWRINDSRAFSFRDSVDVAPSGGIDTVFFQTEPDRGWDTIYCFIPKGKRVEFVYNTCCNYFDPVMNGRRTYDSLLIHSAYRQPLSVGTWEDRIIVPKKAWAFSISETAKSAMTPNIYGLEVRTLSKPANEPEPKSLLFAKAWIFFGEAIVLRIDKAGLVTVSRE